jgi:hypothetical protein
MHLRTLRLRRESNPGSPAQQANTLCKEPFKQRFRCHSEFSPCDATISVNNMNTKHHIYTIWVGLNLKTISCYCSFKGQKESHAIVRQSTEIISATVPLMNGRVDRVGY